jgi:uncharacterized membrane protein
MIGNQLLGLLVLVIMSTVMGGLFVFVRRVPARPFWIATGICFGVLAYVGIRSTLETGCWSFSILPLIPLVTPVLVTRHPAVRSDSWVTFWLSSIAFGLSSFIAVGLFVLTGLTGWTCDAW